MRIFKSAKVAAIATVSLLMTAFSTLPAHAAVDDPGCSITVTAGAVAEQNALALKGAFTILAADSTLNCSNDGLIVNLTAGDYQLPNDGSQFLTYNGPWSLTIQGVTGATNVLGAELIDIGNGLYGTLYQHGSAFLVYYNPAKSLTIDGVVAKGLYGSDGGGFVTSTAATTSLSHVDVRYTSGNEGGSCSTMSVSGSLNISNSYFSDNGISYTPIEAYRGTGFDEHVIQNGGALCVNTGNSMDVVDISHSYFYHNHAAKNGGAIYTQANHNILTDTVISGNVAAEKGAGVFAFATPNTGAHPEYIVEVIGSTISSNNARIAGAGIAAASVKVESWDTGDGMQQSDLSGNSGWSGYNYTGIGSAIYATYVSSVGANYDGNMSGSGGAIYLTPTWEFPGYGSVTSKNSSLFVDNAFTNNAASTGSGGAIFSNVDEIAAADPGYKQMALRLYSNTFDSNTAQWNGGAVFAYSAAVSDKVLADDATSVVATGNHSTFSKNTVSYNYGGGIAAGYVGYGTDFNYDDPTTVSGGKLEVYGTYFDTNEADTGAGIATAAGTSYSIQSSSFYSNHSKSTGAALAVGSNGLGYVLNSTFTNNFTESTGTIFSVAQGSAAAHPGTIETGTHLIVNFSTLKNDGQSGLGDFTATGDTTNTHISVRGSYLLSQSFFSDFCSQTDIVRDDGLNVFNANGDGLEYVSQCFSESNQNPTSHFVVYENGLSGKVVDAVGTPYRPLRPNSVGHNIAVKAYCTAYLFGDNGYELILVDQRGTSRTDTNYCDAGAYQIPSVTVTAKVSSGPNGSITQGDALPTVGYDMSLNDPVYNTVDYISELDQNWDTSAPTCSIFADDDFGAPDFGTEITNSDTPGTYWLACSGDSSVWGYPIKYVPTSFVIKPTPVVVNPINQTITTNDQVPSSFSYQAYYDDEVGNAFTGPWTTEPTCYAYTADSNDAATGTKLTDASADGLYPVFCSGGVAANGASVRYEPGTLEIQVYTPVCIPGDPCDPYYCDPTICDPGPTKTDIHLTADTKTWTYGDAPETIGYSLDENVLDGTPVCAAYEQSDTTFSNPLTLTDYTPAGTYVTYCTANSPDGSLYNFYDNAGTLTINKAPAIDVALGLINTTITYGDNPQLYANVGGLVGSDTIDNIADRGFTLPGSCNVYLASDTAFENSLNVSSFAGLSVGNYVIRCTDAPTASNYASINFTDTLSFSIVAAGTVTVTPRDATYVHGLSEPVFHYGTSGLVNGDFIFSAGMTEPTCRAYDIADTAYEAPLTLDTSLPAGTYAIHCDGAAVTANYEGVQYGPDATLTVVDATVTASATKWGGNSSSVTFTTTNIPDGLVGGFAIDDTFYTASTKFTLVGLGSTTTVTKSWQDIYDILVANGESVCAPHTFSLGYSYNYPNGNFENLGWVDYLNYAPIFLKATSVWNPDYASAECAQNVSIDASTDTVDNITNQTVTLTYNNVSKNQLLSFGVDGKTNFAANTNGVNTSQQTWFSFAIISYFVLGLDVCKDHVFTFKAYDNVISSASWTNQQEFNDFFAAQTVVASKSISWKADPSIPFCLGRSLLAASSTSLNSGDSTTITATNFNLGDTQAVSIDGGSPVFAGEMTDSVANVTWNDIRSVVVSSGADVCAVHSIRFSMWNKPYSDFASMSDALDSLTNIPAADYVDITWNPDLTAFPCNEWSIDATQTTVSKGESTDISLTNLTDNQVVGVAIDGSYGIASTTNYFVATYSTWSWADMAYYLSSSESDLCVEHTFTFAVANQNADYFRDGLNSAWAYMSGGGVAKYVDVNWNPDLTASACGPKVTVDNATSIKGSSSNTFTFSHTTGYETVGIAVDGVYKDRSQLGLFQIELGVWTWSDIKSELGYLGENVCTPHNFTVSIADQNLDYFPLFDDALAYMNNGGILSSATVAWSPDTESAECSSKPVVTVTPGTGYTYTYGGTAPTIGFDATGFNTGDSFDTTGMTAPTCEVFAVGDSGYESPITIDSTTPAGDYLVHCSGAAVNSVYDSTVAYGDDGTLTISAAGDVTVTPGSGYSYNYGSNPPTVGYTSSGFLNTDSFATSGMIAPTCSVFAASDTNYSNPITLSSTTTPGSYVVHCYLAMTNGNYNGVHYDVDGTLTINKATSALEYTGTYYLSSNSGGFALQATLSGVCKAGVSVKFNYDSNGDGTYETYLGSATTNSNGTAQYLWTLPGTASMYEIEAVFEGTDNCTGSATTATLVYGSAGDSTNGGGWYNVNGTKVNFGYTAQTKTSKTGVTTTTGQLVWNTKNGNRFKAVINSYVKTACPTGISGTCARVTGTGYISTWDAINRGWVKTSATVGFTATVADGGVVTSCVTSRKGKTCSTSYKQDYFAMSINNYTISGETADLQALKGGNLTAK